MQPMIFQAILGNDVPAFLDFVQEKEWLLEERSEEDLSNTVLHLAAKLGHGEFVSKIIELRPSLVCSRNADGDTPLHLATLLGDTGVVLQMLEAGSKACLARNNKNQTPLHLACRSISTETARIIAEKTESVCLDELDFAISSGSTSIAGIILERFPDLATEEAWVVEGSPSTLLHHACDRGDLELTRILLGLDQGLEEALNMNGLSPLHLAVLRGSVVILREFLVKAPSSFEFLTSSKETVFHLAARNKNMDAFVFMAQSLKNNSQILAQQTDEKGNTVLHVAASTAFAPLIRYIVDNEIVDVSHKNKMGFAASHLLNQEVEDYELLSTWLSFDGDSNGRTKPFESSQDHEVSIGIPKLEEPRELLELIEENKSADAKRGHTSLENEMQIEALQNARNTITIVAVLIASVAFAGGINPPGGVYQDGPSRGKSTVGTTTPFKVFAVCNNFALFTSLCIVILLVSIIPYKRKPLKKLLVITHRMMWVAVGFMATAYVAASWVAIPQYDGTRWLFPAIIGVAGGTLAVLFSYLGVKTIAHWCRKLHSRGNTSTNSDMAASEQSGFFTI